MWFAILGPLLVHDGEVPIDVPKGRQRVLLAALLVRAGKPVPADVLTEVVWDGRPPATAAGTLRSHMTRLRHALGPRAGARLISRYPGYLLQAGEDEVDLLRFRRLCREAGAAAHSGAWGQADEMLGKALVLWRDTPLSDVASEALGRDEILGLKELRLQALEWRIDAGLHLGRHAEILAQLQTLAAEHPLRERFHAQLMLAFYRCGRQAEALSAYQHIWHVLADEVGTEPGPELRQLHQQVLSADPCLAVPAPAAGAREAGPSGTPRELPAGMRHFTGRSRELAALTELLDKSGQQTPGTVVISAIGGTAGVGKTALALHFAHRAAGHFPDGQLYVNLRGFDPAGTPATPAEAVRGFLDALGVPPERIPPGADAQAGLYRSLLAGKQMLIVLDNARDEAQVHPLLPASPASLVIVTSRNQLTGLAAAGGARLLNLDILPHNEAVQLLTARIGTAWAAAEPQAVGEIATLCACLPLALAVTAARAAARPGFPLATLATELRDASSRLDALDAGPAASVRAVFSWSYHQLGPDTARMFRLLSLHPGPDISIPAAASLAGIDQAETRRLLRALARDCLITEHSPGRYAFHDLLRAYAASQARECDSKPDRDAAAGRVLDHYLHTASHSATLVQPELEPVVLPPPRPGTCPERPADHRQAIAWFEAEHQVLLAAVTLAAETGADRHAWQLPLAMHGYLGRRGHLRERVTVMASALAAAARLDDAHGQALSLRGLGSACIDAGDHDQARAHLEHCLPLYQRLGDRRGEAMAQHNLGALADAQRRHRDALGHCEQALRLYRAIGHHAGEAETLNSVAWCRKCLGDYDQARALCEQSLDLIARIGGCWFEYVVRATLGFIERELGNFAKAAEDFESALDLCRDHGDRAFEAVMLTNVGDARHAAGKLPRARQAWQQALAIYDDIRHPAAGEVRAKLAGAQE